MSPRSNGVMKVRRTAISTSRVIVVGVMLAVHDRLAVARHGLAALQHGAQRLGPGDEHAGCRANSVEEALLLRHQSLEPSQHVRLSSQEWPSALIGVTLNL